MKRIDAIKALIGLTDDAPIICANGMISRETFYIKDRPCNFYMLGSMGLASSIGSGVALCKPRKKIIVFDGDGNLLMNLGSLALIGGLGLTNLVHIVFDNESYGSTGYQPTLSSSVNLEKLAKAAGYKTVEKVTKETEIKNRFRRCLNGKGPSFLLIKIINKEDDNNVGRVTLSPEKIKKRFIASL